ncbi:transposase [Rhodocytophaga rosea]|uniref:Transposase n=1 Tax=Rhodocytophaga rosea TaxID=2704465 RepID=A0A6C0GV75_9BACT|nr:transposase [Rhodocytophaga rosea]QHT71463.1 transposase [Rhodocytophaga rosea]
MNKLERKRVGKQETPSMVIIDSQSIKTAPFISENKGMYPNGMVSSYGNKKVNGRKRHILTDTLGLV